MRQIDGFAVGLLLFVAAASPALADRHGDHEGGGCKKVHGIIIDAQVVEGCTSPNRFCAAGEVRANHGLNGTTYFRMDGAVLGPAPAPGSVATSGILTYTTERGTLTVRESGLSGLTTTREYFTAFQEVLEGTDRYAGATGHLWVLGHNLGDHFESEIDGVLCLP